LLPGASRRRFGIAGSIFFDLFIGAAAKFAMPQEDRGGIIVGAILPVIGAVFERAPNRRLKGSLVRDGRSTF
jgi:uncharacterized membrane protein YeaQ/YmgE (transglycosylase-associated protein family)